jgi:AcrR family transcriptional regulator
MKARAAARERAPLKRVSDPGPDAADGSEPVRLRILRGAVQVFGRLGFGGTSVEAILATAGVSRRTFYKEFRSKEDVLRVLFESSVQRLLDAVQVASSTPGPARTRLVASIEAYLAVHSNAGSLARVLLLEQFSPGSPLAAQRDAAMAAFSALITAAIEREGRARPDPMLVHGVVAAVNQIAVQMAAEYPDGDWDIERAKRAMLRLLLALDEQPEVSARVRQSEPPPRARS